MELRIISYYVFTFQVYINSIIYHCSYKMPISTLTERFAQIPTAKIRTFFENLPLYRPNICAKQL